MFGRKKKSKEADSGSHEPETVVVGNRTHNVHVRNVGGDVTAI